MVALLAGYSALSANGCANTAFECEQAFQCATGAGGSTSTASMTGAGGGVMTGCDPAVEKNPVASACGTFVSSSKGDDTAGNGTKEKPYKTIAKATASGAKNLYLC